MTDRVHTLTVVLEKDVRVDDVEVLMNAIGQLRGVLLVDGVISDYDSHMAEIRANDRWRQRLLDLAREE